MAPPPPRPTLFPYTTLFRSKPQHSQARLAYENDLQPSAPVASRNSLRPQRRSEEHTSELQSLRHLVCRLLREKKRQPATPLPAVRAEACRPPGPATTGRRLD